MGKYDEIIRLDAVSNELNMEQIADFLIDLEYDTSHKTHNSIHPCVTIGNMNFIISCYIWYYLRDAGNWEIIEPLKPTEIAEQNLSICRCSSIPQSLHCIDFRVREVMKMIQTINAKDALI